MFNFPCLLLSIFLSFCLSIFWISSAFSFPFFIFLCLSSTFFLAVFWTLLVYNLLFLSASISFFVTFLLGFRLLSFFACFPSYFPYSALYLSAHMCFNCYYYHPPKFFLVRMWENEDQKKLCMCTLFTQRLLFIFSINLYLSPFSLAVFFTTCKLISFFTFQHILSLPLILYYFSCLCLICYLLLFLSSIDFPVFPFTCFFHLDLLMFSIFFIFSPIYCVICLNFEIMVFLWLVLLVLLIFFLLLFYVHYSWCYGKASFYYIVFFGQLAMYLCPLLSKCMMLILTI